MAALSAQTVTSVLFSASATWGPIRTAGESVAKGQPVWYDLTNNIVSLSNSSTTGMSVATEYGLAAYGAGTGQPIQIVTSDPSCTLGTTMTRGYPVMLYSTAGLFTQTLSDVATGKLGVNYGTATTTAILNLKPTIGGIA